jgi:methylated-DNA-[protein]-cysteine S-methyltransferase
MTQKLYKKTMRSPLGALTLVASEGGMRAVFFEKHARIPMEFQKALESSRYPVLVQCEKELREYFEGKRTRFTVPMEISGTEFQEKVWAALSKIPYGKTITYSDQAQSLKMKKAVRAVAAANGRNLLSILIPCHRVIASSGGLQGYAGGLEAKKALIELEQNKSG